MPIDPRIEARWVSVRRAQNRRRRAMAVGVVLGVSAVAGAWLLVHSPVLAARHVVVRGIVHTGRSTVLSVAGLGGGRPMIDVDGRAIDRRILALPWVADVGVRRDWPTTVTIDIRERVPVAEATTTAGGTAIVDRTGRVLAVEGAASGTRATEMAALPRLVGVAVSGPAGSSVAPAAGAALAMLQALDPELVPSGRFGVFVITAASRAADGTLAVSLSPGPITVVFGSSAQLPAKVLALHSVLTQLAPGAGATIDVEIADAPVVTEGS